MAQRRQDHGRTREIPSWDDVRLFLAIHRAGSLSRAAGPLGITQPTCGRRLATLEAAFGFRLFDRTVEGMRITPEGAALLHTALEMERCALDLSLRASAGDAGLEGTVRIGAPPLFASALLVDVLAKLREAHPNIFTQIIASIDDADILRREADVAVRFRAEGKRPTPGELLAKRVGEEPFRLYATDAYLARRGAPADPENLESHDVVAFSSRHPASAWCEQAFRRATVVLTASDMQVVAAAAAAGMGLSVLPERAARIHPELRSLSPVVARATGWIVFHRDVRSVPRIRVVIDTLAAAMRAESG